ncbi:hypothetical protein [Nocardioides sp. InS609-2]|uniref:hypothetical protein n=1 Tax=Nocardioides sp. InS609-2 TaxID=2760705 RepID=UPI0020BDC295|nr:hypothetical protein [Nocardioides sp. InS609-2]
MSQPYPLFVHRPWLDWDRRPFLWTGLSAFVTLFLLRLVLLRLTESRAMELVIQGAAIVAALLLLYVTFTWAAEHDRRHPRE